MTICAQPWRKRESSGLLFLDGTLAQRCRELSPDDFSSPLLAEAYQLLLEAANQGRSPSPAMLEGHFSPEEMGHLTTVLQKPESPSAVDRGAGGLHTRYSGISR